MRFLSITLVLPLILLVSSSSSAWNRPGHMVIAAIAFDELKASHPEVIAKVVEILKHNPFFPRDNPFFSNSWEERIKTLRLTYSDRDLFLFAFAARFPDDARDTKFQVASAHFADFQFYPYGNDLPGDPNKMNIIKAYNDYLLILKSLDRSITSTKTMQDKAIGLSWIFHLIGDVHQPLHTTSLLTNQFPEGDARGENFYVRLSSNSATTSLHSLWDSMVIEADDFQAAISKARELRSMPSYSRSRLKDLSEQDFYKWARESFVMAKTYAYQSGQLKGSTNREAGELLPPDYIKLVKPVAEFQMVLAGYRLADVLANLMGDKPQPQPVPQPSPQLSTHSGGGQSASNLQLVRRLNQSGPQFIQLDANSPLDLSLQAFVTGGWPMVIEYKIEKPAIVLIEITKEGVPPFFVRIRSEKPERRLEKIQIPSRFGNTPTPANYSIRAFDIAVGETGSVKVEILGFGAGPNAVGSVGIDELVFGPETINPKKQQQAKYAFHARNDFNSAVVIFNKITKVSKDHLRAVPIGEEEIRSLIYRDSVTTGSWDGKNKEGKFAQGTHQLQVKAWIGADSGGSWVSAWSGHSVNVILDPKK